MRTKEIKQKIKSVGNIKKITKTMEMVSISKMRRAVDHALASRTYSHYALELLVNLSKDKNVTNPLMISKKTNKELIVVIASNKGLCGGYHTNLYKALASYLKSDPSISLRASEGKINAITIGKYAEKICKKLDIATFASFNTFSEFSTIEQTKELSDLIRAEYVKGDYESVKILYTEFLKSTTYKPVLREIFPINVGTIENILETFVEPAPAEVLLSKNASDYQEKNKEKEEISDFTDYKFEPDLNEILESILPGLVDVVVYQTLAEAFASEHSARMFAMKNASDNAGGLVDDLTLQYNKARQAAITQEISEIVGGAEALN